MTIRLISFGYGHKTKGVPTAEVTYDVSGKKFRNPFHDPALKHLTGLDQAVYDHVRETPGIEILAQSAAAAAIGLVDETDGDVVLAFGCVGGRHRSVGLARLTGELLELCGRQVEIEHRDVDEPLLPAGAHSGADVLLGDRTPGRGLDPLPPHPHGM
ncbi:MULTISPECIES: RNase adapter RapZ [unclassified Streptomyces]|uniref:RapZ C-terminal domain-containing protein n=1 Tax=unclassified Streptomyces TaxID=2593676 RepID=UPI00332CD521